MTRGFYHILHTGCFAYEHTVRVVLFEYGIEGVNLFVYKVACNLILGVDEQQLPLVALEQACYAFRQNFLRNFGANHGLKPKNIFNAVHLFHFFNHFANGACGSVCTHKHHMGGRNVEIL